MSLHLETDVLQKRIPAWKILATLVVLFCMKVQAADRQLPNKNLSRVVAKLQPVGRLPANNRMSLAIGLSPRNQEALADLTRQIGDPRSASFHHYLTPEEIMERFSPTEADYLAVINFARANGLEVTQTHGNRMVLDVAGKVQDIEKAFHVVLR